MRGEVCQLMFAHACLIQVGADALLLVQPAVQSDVVLLWLLARLANQLMKYYADWLLIAT
jgi:hypothetical protein